MDSMVVESDYKEYEIRVNRDGRFSAAKGGQSHTESDLKARSLLEVRAAIDARVVLEFNQKREQLAFPFKAVIYSSKDKRYQIKQLFFVGVNRTDGSTRYKDSKGKKFEGQIACFFSDDTPVEHIHHFLTYLEAEAESRAARIKIKKELGGSDSIYIPGSRGRQTPEQAQRVNERFLEQLNRLGKKN